MTLVPFPRRTASLTNASSVNRYERQPYAEHLARMARDWKQGEHILVCGPTSSGKTTLVRPMLERRSHVVGLFTKIKDPTILKEFAGWRRYEKWPKHGIPKDETRVMIWPKPGRTLAETRIIHRDVMRDALDAVSREGNRCVYIDEGLYLADAKYGNLSADMGMLHYFGRSSGISMVTTAQRPFYLPKVILSSITHGYFARTRDRDDLKRLADIGSVDTKEVAANLAALEDRHDFVYLNPQGDGKPAVVNARR